MQWAWGHAGRPWTNPRPTSSRRSMPARPARAGAAGKPASSSGARAWRAPPVARSPPARRSAPVSPLPWTRDGCAHRAGRAPPPIDPTSGRPTRHPAPALPTSPHNHTLSSAAAPSPATSGLPSPMDAPLHGRRDTAAHMPRKYEHQRQLARRGWGGGGDHPDLLQLQHTQHSPLRLVVGQAREARARHVRSGRAQRGRALPRGAAVRTGASCYAADAAPHHGGDNCGRHGSEGKDFKWS